MKKLTCAVLCVLFASLSHSMNNSVDVVNNTNSTKIQSSIFNSEEYFADVKSLTDSLSLSQSCVFSAEHIFMPVNTQINYENSQISEDWFNSNEYNSLLSDDDSSSSSSNDVDIFGYLNSSSCSFEFM